MENGYAVIDRKWQKGDQIQLILPMDVKKVIANKALTNDQNKISLQRGPIMYCAEWQDNTGSISNITIPANAQFIPVNKPVPLNGITVLKGEAVEKSTTSTRSK